jgi:hypothetical protein
MDRGYLDFERLYALDQAGSFFVTRANRNLDARRLYSAPVDRDTGLICDQVIALNGFYAAKHYPGHLRCIRYRIPRPGPLPSDRLARAGRPPGHEFIARECLVDGFARGLDAGHRQTRRIE